MAIQTAVYTENGVAFHDDPVGARDAAGTTWVRATVPDPEALRRLGEGYGLHELAVEDVRNGVRPKVEEFEDHTFVLIAEAELRHGETTFEEELRDVAVGLFVGEDWLVTLTAGRVDAVDRVWGVMRREERRLLGRGADFAAYRVIDAVVDDYFAALDEIEDDIERVEDDVIRSPDVATLEEINSIRRELLSLRRLLWPSREAVGVLARGDPDQIREPTEKYFRDVYDHLVQLVELTETYRDLVGGARDIYLNSLSASTNEVMKRLTIVATVFLPLTFVAGVYGMNFEHMPELSWRLGYPAVLLGMAVLAVAMVAYFSHRDWI